MLFATANDCRFCRWNRYANDRRLISQQSFSYRHPLSMTYVVVIVSDPIPQSWPQPAQSGARVCLFVACQTTCFAHSDVPTLSRWTLTTRNMSFSRSLRVLNKVIISVIHYSVWDSYMNAASLLYLRLAIPHKGSVIKLSIYYILYSEFVRFYKHIYRH